MDDEATNNPVITDLAADIERGVITPGEAWRRAFTRIYGTAHPPHRPGGRRHLHDDDGRVYLLHVGDDQ